MLLATYVLVFIFKRVTFNSLLKKLLLFLVIIYFPKFSYSLIIRKEKTFLDLKERLTYILFLKIEKVYTKYKCFCLQSEVILVKYACSFTYLHTRNFYAGKA